MGEGQAARFMAARMALIDFTNPEACRWFAAKLETLLEMGVDAFKTDFGERIPLDVVYHDGADPASMHNYYSYLYARCVFELLERVKGKGQAVVFARSATVGSQQFPVHWGGDSTASYASMAETLRGGLSLAMSGFAFWSHDISGFEQTATADLYKRWAAFGMLSSHSVHGSSSYRVPWLFDDESSDIVRHFVRLKHRLMPYIFRAAMEARDTGAPVMRPMVFEFPVDPATADLDMQYMLGGSLLVAPVFADDGRADYYLPDGAWTDYFTGHVRTGGRWYSDVYDYFSLPLYVRPGTLLALGAEESRTGLRLREGRRASAIRTGRGADRHLRSPHHHGRGGVARGSGTTHRRPHRPVVSPAFRWCAGSCRHRLGVRRQGSRCPAARGRYCHHPPGDDCCRQALRPLARPSSGSQRRLAGLAWAGDRDSGKWAMKYRNVNPKHHHSRAPMPAATRSPCCWWFVRFK